MKSSPFYSLGSCALHFFFNSVRRIQNAEPLVILSNAQKLFKNICQQTDFPLKLNSILMLSHFSISTATFFTLFMFSYWNWSCSVEVVVNFDTKIYQIIPFFSLFFFERKNDNNQNCIFSIFLVSFLDDLCWFSLLTLLFDVFKRRSAHYKQTHTHTNRHDWNNILKREWEANARKYKLE